MLRYLSVLLAAVALAACAPQAPPESSSGDAAAIERDIARRYDALARAGQPVFDVDPARSLVVMEVRRAGSLANLGHDHVVASHDLHGYVAPAAGRADVLIRVDTLAVDEPALRSAAGFDTQPTADDIAGTRRNMLSRVLSADAHPAVVAEVTGVAARGGPQVLHPSVSVNGVARAVDAPAEIEVTAGEIRVTGRATVKQTEFGIRPFSILGGALEVADAVAVRFEIVARRR